MTPLCIASALNMNYLDDVAHQLGPEERSLEPLRQKIDDNAVVGYLRKFGYSYVDVCSGQELTRVSTADLILNDDSDQVTLDEQVFSLTPLSARKETRHQRYKQHRDHILGIFRSLNTVAQLPYSKFVFAHILAPHPPFVFGPNGEAIDPGGPLNYADGSWLLEQISRDEYKRGYIAQMQFINKQVLEAVDSILRQSSRPPIIIIQGDHGSRMNLDWESQARTDLREPFSILNAYYVPKKVRGDLYDTITPVNSFRILLTSVFGAKFPRLPDRSFYTTNSHPYDFSDVTELITRERSTASSSPTSGGTNHVSHSIEKGRAGVL
jgi:hypothetical protein